MYDGRIARAHRHLGRIVVADIIQDFLGSLRPVTAGLPPSCAHRRAAENRVGSGRAGRGRSFLFLVGTFDTFPMLASLRVYPISALEEEQL